MPWGFHYLALRRVGGKSMRDSTDILHHLDGPAPRGCGCSPPSRG